MNVYAAAVYVAIILSTPALLRVHLVHAQTLDEACGPPDVSGIDESIRGKLDAKVQALLRFGQAEIVGAAERTRSEIINGNRSDAARELHYVHRQICVAVFSDKRLDSAQKRIAVLGPAQGVFDRPVYDCAAVSGDPVESPGNHLNANGVTYDPSPDVPVCVSASPPQYCRIVASELKVVKSYNAHLVQGPVTVDDGFQYCRSFRSWPDADNGKVNTITAQLVATQISR